MIETEFTDRFTHLNPQFIAEETAFVTQVVERLECVVAQSGWVVRFHPRLVRYDSEWGTLVLPVTFPANASLAGLMKKVDAQMALEDAWNDQEVQPRREVRITVPNPELDIISIPPPLSQHQYTK